MSGKIRKIFSLVLILSLIFQQVGFAQVANQLNVSNYLPGTGSSVGQDRFRPLHLRYFSYNNLNDNFKIILDKGNLKPKELETAKLKIQAQELLNYFLVGVTLPDSMFWVNLRPDAQDNIIDAQLARTDVGKVMLEADLQLKKDTSAFTSPRTAIGKEYWSKLYKKSAELYGNSVATIPTLTRPWIVPGEIIVRETSDSAYVYKANLKVMLEQDALKNSAAYNFKDDRAKALNEYSSQLIRDLVIPQLTKEVNSAKRYASLRQVYYSLILARWFKLHFANKTGTYASLINAKNLTNLVSRETWSKAEYFKQYQKSFAKGEYNEKEQVYTPAGQMMRTYFSGGVNMEDIKTDGFVDNKSGNLPQGEVLVGVAGKNVLKTSEELSSDLMEQEILPNLSKLEQEKFEEQFTSLFGMSYEEVKAVNPYLAKIAFDGKSSRLGWTTAMLEWIIKNPDKLEKVIEDGKFIRDNFKYVIFCGMGGSGLSVQAVKDTFGEKEVKIFSLRTTDPQAISDILNEIASLENGNLAKALSKTLVIPISKSGTTQETVSHKKYFEDLFSQLGVKAKDHLWVVTDTGSPMDTGVYTQREIQLNGKGDIGGRFTSPLTNIFLFPLAIIAPDKVGNILKVAKEMNVVDINHDDFLKLGAYLYYLAAKQGKDKLTIFVPEELKSIPSWSEQLIEESLGKDGKGVTLFYGEKITPEVLKSKVENDRVFFRVNIGGKKTNQELWDHLKANGYPVFEINIKDVDSVGGIMLGLQRTVAAVAYLWDICFVNQPAVEGYKKATREVMQSIQPGESVEAPASWKHADYKQLKLYYTPLVEAGVITEGQLQKEVNRLGYDLDNAPAVYAAIVNLLKAKGNFEAAEITSYGKITKGLRNILEDVRYNLFTNGLKMPTKLGEGPDKNHSYHQNIEAGKDMWFSTYFMANKIGQPKDLAFDDNLLKAQAIGTAKSLVAAKRSVVLIAFDGTTEGAEPDVKEFFAQVSKILNAQDKGIITEEASQLITKALPQLSESDLKSLQDYQDEKVNVNYIPGSADEAYDAVIATLTKIRGTEKTMGYPIFNLNIDKSKVKEASVAKKAVEIGTVVYGYDTGDYSTEYTVSVNFIEGYIELFYVVDPTRYQLERPANSSSLTQVEYPILNSIRPFNEGQTRKQLDKILHNLRWAYSNTSFSDSEKSIIRAVEENHVLAGPGTDNDHYENESPHKELSDEYRAVIAKMKLATDTKITEIINWVKEDLEKFKGEEVHVLNGVGPDAKVVGRIDRNIAEKFGFVHETANVVLLDPDGKIVLQLRNKKNYDDHLAMYGGHLEVGESHPVGALNEARQETGMPKDYNFKLPMIFIGQEGYSYPSDNNRERRSWFVQRLTKEEWDQMKIHKAEDEKLVGANKDKDDRKAYKTKLSGLWKDGKGEVTGIYSFSMQEIASALKKENNESKLPDKNCRYLTVIDSFQGKSMKEDVFFTPDSLDLFVNNQEFVNQLKAVINDLSGSLKEQSGSYMYEGEPITSKELPKTVADIYRDRDLLWAMSRNNSEGAKAIELNPKTAEAVKFATSGDRGTFDDSNLDKRYNVQRVLRVVQGIADYYNKNQLKGAVAIGYDNRLLSREYAYLTAAVLAANNIKAELTFAATPVPVVAYAVAASQVTSNPKAGGIIITASHNPWEFNGIKWVLPNGGAAPAGVTNQIQDAAREATQAKIMPVAKALNDNLLIMVDLKNYYIDYIISKLPKEALGKIQQWGQNLNNSVTINSMQGAGIGYLSMIAKKLGIKNVNEINITLDRLFGQVKNEPNPDSAEDFDLDIFEANKNGKQIVELLQDGDDDRFGVRDINGERFSANELIPLIAAFLWEKGYRGKIGKTIATSNFSNAVDKSHGQSTLETDTGFKNLVDALESGEYLVVGEESAHVGVGIFKLSKDDAFAVGLMSLWIIAEKGSLTDYQKEVESKLGKHFKYKRIDIKYEEKDGLGVKGQQMVDLIDLPGAATIVQETASGEIFEFDYVGNEKLFSKFNIIDQKIQELAKANGGIAKILICYDKAAKKSSGYKIIFANDNWIAIRVSGTGSPVIRLYVEVIAPSATSNWNDVHDQSVKIWQDFADAARDAIGLIKIADTIGKVNFIFGELGNRAVVTVKGQADYEVSADNISLGEFRDQILNSLRQKYGADINLSFALTSGNNVTFDITNKVTVVSTDDEGDLIQSKGTDGLTLKDAKGPGGIDFRVFSMNIQPMGSFKGLDFSLPRLTNAELAQVNIDSELVKLRNMIGAGTIPSGSRIKELAAACWQKKEINYRLDNLLLDIFKLEEQRAFESSPELKEALVIVNAQG